MVINFDDSYGAKLAAATNAEVNLSYGLTAAAKVRAVNIDLGKDASRFIMETPGKNFPVRLPIIGRHNIYNALAAAGAGLALKIPAATLQSAFSTMRPVPGRLEGVAAGQPFSVFVDYAHTDDALLNVLGTLREITPGQLLLAFGCGGNRDAGKRAKMGRVAAQFADFTIITSDNPRKESAADIAAQIEEGFHSLRAEGCAVELDRSRAIAAILARAQAGDTVLIAGKGHETCQEFEDTVVPFDDRVHAREALENLGFTG